MMKGRLWTIALLVWTALCCPAQKRSIQYKPYIDLRPMHFGILVGMNLQDIEFNNVGPQTVTLEDGTTEEKTIVCDADRWNAGFSVGVLADLRLSNHLNLRFSPTMHFGAKHLTFHNLTDLDQQGNPREERQDMKNTYVSFPGSEVQCRALEQLSSLPDGWCEPDDQPDEQKPGLRGSEAWRHLLRDWHGL